MRIHALNGSTAFSVVGILLAIALAGAIGRASRVLAEPADDNASEAVQDAAAKLKAEFAEYRSWKPINAEPVKVEDFYILFCRPPTTPPNPHAGRYVSVYVSAAGRDAYVDKKPLPVGTVIVKEKLHEKSDDSAHELGVMIKRDKGFDADAGDWQFLFVDQDEKLIADRKDVANCRSCHQARKESDYVFRKIISMTDPKTADAAK